jgi:Cof subfamily protein (haloacid dehalogenase superfamily)
VGLVLDRHKDGGRFRLVAIDVDGTLVGRDRRIAPAVKRSIARARQRGVVVTLASGRMFPLVEPLVAELELTSPLICYGGALIVDPVVRRPIFRRGVPLDLAREVIRAARARDLSARAYVDDKVFVDVLRPGHFNYDSLLRIQAIEVGDLLAFLADDPSHLAVDAEPARTRDLVLEMRGLFAPRLNVTTGHPLLTEFSHPSVHKGSGLAWLAAHLGVPVDEVLAIGDDWNDLEMLRYAGLGLAVANAHPDVLAAADAIVPGVDEDGVAVAIERYVLGDGGRGTGDGGAPSP